MIALLAACTDPETTTDATGAPTTSSPTSPTFPIPDDLDGIDFEGTFEAAMRTLVTVTAATPWRGHVESLEAGVPGCPDFWTEPFTVGGVLVSRTDGVAWNDDCRAPAGAAELAYDGWIWWDAAVSELGDPSSYDGRVTEGVRTLEGDATVERLEGDAEEIRFEFDGTASDSLYRVRAANDYERFVYNSQVDATVTGAELFAGTETPDGYRTDLVISLTGGDVDNFEGRGDLYLFSPQLEGRFDSIGLDLELQGPKGAGPGACTLEPLGWLGVRDPDAIWYDVVFQPRFEEDLGDGTEFPNDPLSVCDGCGRLYVQGIPVDDPETGEPREVCVDFSFLFDGTVPLPDTPDYVLPWRSFEP